MQSARCDAVHEARTCRRRQMVLWCACLTGLRTCRHLKAAGSPGLVVDPGRIVWSPFSAERDAALFRS